MKRLSFLVLAVITAVAGTASAQNNPPPDIQAMAKKVMMPLVLKVPGMDKVKVVPNLKYTGSDDPNVLMDVYVPPDVAEGAKRPVVIFLHGGAKTDYTPKDWRIYTDWGRLIAASGFIGVALTHRLEYPNPSLEKAAANVRDAINYVRSNADKYHIDKDRICLNAYSAGGPLLTLAMHGDMPFVRCLVGFYSFMDIQQSDYAKTEKPETVKAFSAIRYLEEDGTKIPPMFLARAGHDEVPTMLDSIDRFVAKALSANIPITVMNHPQGVHGFDNQNDDDRSREIIRAAIEFIKVHLGESG